MTRRGFATTPVVGGWGHLPWTVVADLAGLIIAVTLVGDWLGLRQSVPSLFLLFGFGFVTWLVLQRLQPKRPRPVKVDYRSTLVPSMAAALTIAACRAAHEMYSSAAIAVFVIVWTTWLCLGRYALGRLGPPLRVVCIGDAGIARELSAQRRFHVVPLRSATDAYLPVDLVIVGTREPEDESWFRWLLRAELSGVPLMSAERARELLTGRAQTQFIGERWERDAPSGVMSYLAWKRGFDVLAVLLASPIILLLSALSALVVLLDSGGPVLFSQLRVGKDGRPFRIYKFRTMCRDAEARGAAFASEDDPRVTPVGRWLRRTRMDELPQFWNVLRGEMSVIGPRPEQVGFAQWFDSDIPQYTYRHSVRPGITGWAQVRQGYAVGPAESSVKASYDLYYVKYCSPLLDASIIFQTLRILVSGVGAR